MTERETSPKFAFQPLGKQHDRGAFSCGSPHLDRYLKTQARQDADKKLAAVYVLTPDGKTISGYYTLSQYSIQLDVIPEEIKKGLTKHPIVPATLIGRLARSVRFKGQNIGELLLMDALYRCLLGSREAASWAVIVDAKDDRAIAFYRRFGFIEIPAVPNRLFLPMKTVEDMFRDS